MLGVLSGAAQRVQEQALGLQEQALEKGAELRELINKERERQLPDLGFLKEAGYGVKKGAGDRYVRVRRDGQRALFDLTGPVRARVLGGLRESIKSVSVADPDMCECIRNRIEGLVDLFWDDLTVYVDKNMDDAKAGALGQAVTDVEELAVFGEKPTCLSFRWWRAWLLFHYLPFDISVFGQVKDVVFWIFTVISLIPFYGVRCAFFLVVLICMLTGNPADEYQLVGFILGFKGTQFISSGVMQAIIAAFKYYMCVHPGGTHTCDTNGPGADQDIVSGLIDFFGSCVLTWAAFLCLPCSSHSAGMRELGIDEETLQNSDLEASRKAGCLPCCKSYDREKGGRLRGLLGYDFACFLISCGLAFLLMYIDAAQLRPGGNPPLPNVGLEEMVDDANRWTGHSAIFWARVLYSMMAAPFTVFMLPGLSGILTHTTPTGYNQYGMCVPFTLHPMPKDKAN